MHYIPIYQVVLKRLGSLRTEQRQFRHSRDAAELLRQYLSDVDREHFVVCALNRKNRVIGLHTVSIGSLTASVVHPREVLKFLILSNASACILGHNHPSGDVQPSSEDRALTVRLQQAARIHGIAILDHIILATAATAT